MADTEQNNYGLPSNFVPVETAPIIPGVPSSNPQIGPGQYFAGPLSSSLQHDAAFYQTKYGGSAVPEFPLIPVAPVGIPSANAGVTSIIEQVSSSSGESASVGFTAPLEAVITGSPAGATEVINWAWALENPYTVFSGSLGFQYQTPAGLAAEASGTGTVVTTPSLTPSITNELAFFAVSAASATVTAPGWTSFGSSGDVFAQVLSSTFPISGAATLSAPQSGGWASGLITFGLSGGSIPSILHSGNTSGSFSPPVSFSFTSGSTSAGNTVLIFLSGVTSASVNNAGLSIVDNLGNLYAHPISQCAGLSSAELDIFVLQNCPAGINTFTIYSSHSGFPLSLFTGCFAYEVSGSIVLSAPAIPSFKYLIPQFIPPISLSSSANGGVFGNLPVTNLNNGTGASSSTFWRGDGTWGNVSSGGGANVSSQISANTNFGVALTTQTVVASMPSTGLVFLTVQAIESLVGVGCSAASNSVLVTVSYTDANTNTVETITTTFSESGVGALTPTAYLFSNALGSSISLAAKIGTAITYTTTSILGSTGCSTIPQYTVYAKAIY